MAKIDRRDFLKLVGAGGVGTGAGILLGESIKHPVEQLIPYPVAPEDFSPGIASWYNTTCTRCGAGCGIRVRVREGAARKIEGNPVHPVSQGKVCARGQAGLHELYNPDRLTAPVMRTDPAHAQGLEEIATTPHLRQASWNEALTAVSDRLKSLVEAGNGDRICLLTRGHRGHLGALFEQFASDLGTQRYWHHDFSHPTVAYAANELFFGERQLPYYDIHNSNFVLSFGADFLGTWLSPVHYGLGYGHGRQGRQGIRSKLVQIEPRMSLTGANADTWIPARPGTEGLVALAMGRRILDQGGYGGADGSDWEAALRDFDADTVAGLAGVNADRIRALADAFAAADPGLAIGGGAAAAHTNGLGTMLAINALNHLAGSVGRQGGVIFNPPPAFGPEPQARQASYADMLSLAEDARAGRIDVLIVHDANPVYALPEASEIGEALRSVPFIVSLSGLLDETTSLADVVLPSHSYLESWGDDTPEPGVGFPVGTISQPVMAPLYNTRSTGDILIALREQMGLEQPWASMEQYLKQGWQEIYSQRRAGIEAASFDEFWTQLLRSGVWGEKVHRQQGPASPDRSALQRIAIPAPQFAGDESEYPFAFHPYESVAFGHGQDAHLPWMQELPDPLTSVVYGSWVEINPKTADEMGLRQGDVVEVESPHGKVRAPVLPYPAIRPDVIAMPMGQGHETYGQYASGRGANPIRILAPSVEPETGALAWAATRVRLVKTGEKARVLTTGGTSRELGRNLVQIARTGDNPGHTLPIKVKTE